MKQIISYLASEYSLRVSFGALIFAGLLTQAVFINTAIAQSQQSAETELESIPGDEAPEKEQIVISDKDSCRMIDGSPAMVDRMRKNTRSSLCGAVRWIDSRFGDDHEFDGSDFTGLVSVGFRQDEEDGFDPRVRVRIKTKLPNVSSRFNAFIGRVDSDSYISNTETAGNRVN
ncbi:MAG: hypothetical protein AAF197_09470, partial [Pseudomonadota bacterium]